MEINQPTRKMEFAVMRWINDGNRLSVHNVKHIVETGKGGIQVGCDGLAVYPGYPGHWSYRILRLGGKTEMKKWLNDNIHMLTDDASDSFISETANLSKQPTNTNSAKGGDDEVLIVEQSKLDANSSKRPANTNSANGDGAKGGDDQVLIVKQSKPDGYPANSSKRPANTNSANGDGAKGGDDQVLIVKQSKPDDHPKVTPKAPGGSNQAVQSGTGQYVLKEEFQNLKEDVRHLRSKIRKLEDRMTSTMSTRTEENPDQAKLGLVEHLTENDGQQVLLILTKSMFTQEELINCSRTGKRTGKCVGTPRPPLNLAKLEMLQRLVMKKTKMTKECFVKKFENLQKTMRQKEQKQ